MRADRSVCCDAERERHARLLGGMRGGRRAAAWAGLPRQMGRVLMRGADVGTGGLVFFRRGGRVSVCVGGGGRHAQAAGWRGGKTLRVPTTTAGSGAVRVFVWSLWGRRLLGENAR